MNAVEAIREIVEERLTSNSGILNSWRKQDLAKSKRVKNFENWLLVEIVHGLRSKKIAKRIRTNGRVRTPSYKDTDILPLLNDRKKKSGSLSPDLSIEILPYKAWLDIDIKTQTASQVVIDDAKIAKYHNQNERNTNHRAAFLWVVIEPEDPEFARRVRKSADGIVRRAKQIGLSLQLKEIKKASWLRYSFAEP